MKDSKTELQMPRGGRRGIPAKWVFLRESGPLWWLPTEPRWWVGGRGFPPSYDGFGVLGRYRGEREGGGVGKLWDPRSGWGVKRADTGAGDSQQPGEGGKHGEKGAQRECELHSEFVREAPFE